MLMSLQLIYGPSGSGKSYTLYKKIIEQSIREPDREFIVIVPEQFTMQTQRELVELHPNRGILNIDVQSFLRLAWRIFEEVGVDTHTVLEDTGKNLLLRRVASRQKNDLTVLGRNFRKPGYISQVKSIISELKQYDVSLEELDEQLRSGKKDALSYKLQDIRNLYEGFQEELQGKYITSEEILEELCYVVKKSEILKGCVVALDGFTGFTPVQNRLLAELMKLAGDVAYQSESAGKSSYKQTQGYTNIQLESTKIKDQSNIVTTATKVNDGAITQYPYVLDDITIAKTHGQLEDAVADDQIQRWK